MEETHRRESARSGGIQLIGIGQSGLNTSLRMLDDKRQFTAQNLGVSNAADRRLNKHVITGHFLQPAVIALGALNLIRMTLVDVKNAGTR